MRRPSLGGEENKGKSCTPITGERAKEAASQLAPGPADVASAWGMGVAFVGCISASHEQSSRSVTCEGLGPAPPSPAIKLLWAVVLREWRECSPCAWEVQSLGATASQGQEGGVLSGAQRANMEFAVKEVSRGRYLSSLPEIVQPPKAAHLERRKRVRNLAG